MFFDLAYIDPPWAYKDSNNPASGIAAHYSGMPDDVLMDLPIRNILSVNGFVALWATATRLDFAIDLLRAWELRYYGILFVWVKTNKHTKYIQPSNENENNRNGLFCGVGNVTRGNAELLLLAKNDLNPIKTNISLNLAKQSNGQYLVDAIPQITVPNVIIHRILGHSRKPVIFQKQLDLLFPSLTKAYFFSRPPLLTQNWATKEENFWYHFGDEIDGLDIFDAIGECALLDAKTLREVQNERVSLLTNGLRHDKMGLF